MIIPFRFEEHSQMINDWGKKHGFPLPPKEFLSDIGLVVDDTCAGFLYTSNSKIAWIEWVFSNPEKPIEERAKALDNLMKGLEQFAILQGSQVLLSAAGSDAYRSIVERNGFIQTDQNMTHHMKRIEL
jgi:hypothetical protein